MKSSNEEYLHRQAVSQAEREDRENRVNPLTAKKTKKHFQTLDVLSAGTSCVNHSSMNLGSFQGIFFLEVYIYI